MTSFQGLVTPLSEQLDTLSTQAKTAILKYDLDTTLFGTYTIKGVNGTATGSVSFLGKGADACVTAVNHNVSRAQHVIMKLSDFQTACDHTKAALEELCSPFDNEVYYHITDLDLFNGMPSGEPNLPNLGDYIRGANGGSDSTNSSIIWRIREDTLPGLSLDDLLTPGKGQQLLEDGIAFGSGCILTDLQR